VLWRLLRGDRLHLRQLSLIISPEGEQPAPVDQPRRWMVSGTTRTVTRSSPGCRKG